eukprot:720745-Prymnesium_polylepis.1
MVTEPFHSSISRPKHNRKQQAVRQHGCRVALLSGSPSVLPAAHPRTRVLSHAPCYPLSNPYIRCLSDAGDHPHPDAVDQHLRRAPRRSAPSASKSDDRTCRTRTNTRCRGCVDSRTCTQMAFGRMKAPIASR